MFAVQQIKSKSLGQEVKGRLLIPGMSYGFKTDYKLEKAGFNSSLLGPKIISTLRFPLSAAYRFLCNSLQA